MNCTRSNICKLFFCLILVGILVAVPILIIHYNDNNTYTPLVNYNSTLSSSVSISYSISASNSPSYSYSTSISASPKIDKLPDNFEDNTKVLILHDSTGDFGYLGELYAISTANLVSHFSTYKIKRVIDYQIGDILLYSHVIYVGAVFDESIPTHFLNDVIYGMNTVNIMWIGVNIWELVTKDTEHLFGWRYNKINNNVVDKISYKGYQTDRDPNNESDLVEVQIIDNTKAQVLAHWNEFTLDSNTTIPWALKSGRFTFISESPFTYTSLSDRYLIFADILHDFFDSNPPIRYRALVRLEDIEPTYNVDSLLSIVNYLYEKRIPFSMAVYPIYKKLDQIIKLTDRPLLVNALKYAQLRGGTIIIHGLTHQYSNVKNPTGESGLDWEFFLVHLAEDGISVIDEPVPEDSVEWMNGRINTTLSEYRSVDVSPSNIWEFPHYLGSHTDYQVVANRFPYRYDRGTYFAGSLSNTNRIDHSKYISQYFPYTATDIYGSKIIPENLGNYVPNVVTPDIILYRARLHKYLVRDSVSSFFYHPYLGVEVFDTIVTGLLDIGYTFVKPADLFE